MSETRPYVKWELINNFMIDVFKAYGVPEADAAICADVLLESDRRGIESHGCNRFKPIYLDRIKNGTLLPKTECEIVKEGPCTILMDAHNGMGMVASHKMMEMLIEKAKVNGLRVGTGPRSEQERHLESSGKECPIDKRERNFFFLPLKMTHENAIVHA